MARDYVASSEAQAIINIVDASNLERNLYLTAQLLELQIPMVVVVNMLDVAKTHGLEINLEKLQAELGCPVVGIVASRKKGIDDLKQALDKQLSEPRLPSIRSHSVRILKRRLLRLAQFLPNKRFQDPDGSPSSSLRATHRS